MVCTPSNNKAKVNSLPSLTLLNSPPTYLLAVLALGSPAI